MTENNNLELKQENKKEKFNILKELYDQSEVFFMSIVIVLLLLTFVVRTVMVDGSSMLPTLVGEERLLISDFFYTPTNGDIVVTSVPISPNAPYVKRIIATEGQTVDIDFEEGVVYVDGNALDEPVYNGITEYDTVDYYINTPTNTPSQGSRLNFPVTVPEGMMFVMGDNRNGSKDSRYADVGMLDQRNVQGKVFFRWFPFDKIGFVK